jgi:hypothetical protein
MEGTAFTGPIRRQSPGEVVPGGLIIVRVARDPAEAAVLSTPESDCGEDLPSPEWPGNWKDHQARGAARLADLPYHGGVRTLIGLFHESR